jgi:hypothetical protein
MDSIVRVYRYSNQYKDLAYPVADIRISGHIIGNPIKFAKNHGGDFIKILSLEDSDDLDDLLQFEIEDGM